MNTHFITYRPNSDRSKPNVLDRYEDFLSWKELGYIEDWSARKTFQPGDLTIFYIASPLNSIVSLGIVDSDPYYVEVDNPADHKNPVYCDFRPVWFLDNVVPIKPAINRQKLDAWWRTRPYQSIRRIETPVAQALIQDILSLNPKLLEDFRKLGFSLSQPPSPEVKSPPPDVGLIPPPEKSPPTPKKNEWDIKHLLNLSWGQFELLIGELFKWRSRDSKVEVTRPTMDYGVDVIINDESLSQTEVVQCKRYRSSVKVSGPDMAKFVGSMAKFRARKGYFITTSTFNRFAVDFAEGMSVELIDGEKLVQMIAEIKEFPSPTEFAKSKR